MLQMQFENIEGFIIFLHCRPPYKQQRGNFSRLMKNLSNFAEISNSMRIWWRSTKLRSADWSCDLSCLTTASWSNSCTLNCCRKIRSTATDIFCVLTVPARIFKHFLKFKFPRYQNMIEIYIFYNFLFTLQSHQQFKLIHVYLLDPIE